MAVVVGSLRQKQNDNEKNEMGEHGRRGESQPAEQGLRRGEGGGGAVCDWGGEGEKSHAICLYVGEKTVDGFNYG